MIFLKFILFTFFSTSFFHLHSEDKNLNAYESMETLKKNLSKDLRFTSFGVCNWKANYKVKPNTEDYDVIIIGSGMAGLTVGAALKKEGLVEFKVFDKAPQFQEGPWITYGKMENLRSTKSLRAASLDIPHLTFEAWYNAKYGEDEWEKFRKPKSKDWMDYLNWYRQVMQIPIENETELLDIKGKGSILELTLKNRDKIYNVTAKKVVLATGRMGFGGPHIPEKIKKVNKKYWYHTTEMIPFASFAAKKIAVVGCGASGFDSAFVALENDAESVDMFIRKSEVPNYNMFASYSYYLYHIGFFHMPDEWRWKMITSFFKFGIPPARDVFYNVNMNKKYTLNRNSEILEIREESDQVVIKTKDGSKQFDYIVLATGFEMNGASQPIVEKLINDVELWRDKVSVELLDENPHFGNFPYLGEHFQFIAKNDLENPHLKNIHFFNFGSLMSHGLMACEIPVLSVAATKLVNGVVIDFYKNQNAKIADRNYDKAFIKRM